MGERLNLNDEEINILDIVKFFNRNRVIILLFVLLTMIFVTTNKLIKPRVYQAESAILATSIKSEVVFESRIKLKESENEAGVGFKDTLKSLSKSRDIAKEVSMQLSNKFENEKKDLSALIGRIKITYEGNSIILNTVSVDPAKASELVNIWAEVAVKKINSLMNEEIDNKDIVLKQNESQVKYLDSLNKYSNYLKNNEVLKIEKELQKNNDLYNYFSNNIIGTEKILYDTEVLAKQVKGSSESSISRFSNDLALLKLKSNAIEGQSDLKVELSLKDLNNASTSDKSITINDIENIINVLKEKKKKFEDILEKEKYAQKINELTYKLEKEKEKMRELQNARDLNWETLNSLERKIQELSISKNLTENITVKVAYLSDIPNMPIKRNLKKTILISFLLGMILGTITAFGIEISRNIDSQSE